MIPVKTDTRTCSCRKRTTQSCNDAYPDIFNYNIIARIKDLGTGNTWVQQHCIARMSSWCAVLCCWDGSFINCVHECRRMERMRETRRDTEREREREGVCVGGGVLDKR